MQFNLVGGVKCVKYYKTLCLISTEKKIYLENMYVSIECSKDKHKQQFEKVKRLNPDLFLYKKVTSLQ